MSLHAENLKFGVSLSFGLKTKQNIEVTIYYVQYLRR